MRALLVCNPKATTTSDRVRDVLVRALRSETQLDVAYTRRRGHAATLAKSATSKQGAGALLVLIIVGVLIVGGLSRALSNLKTWARGPAIVLELLLLPIGYTMITNGLAYVGIPVVLIGLFGAGLLLAPATRAALGLDRYGSQ